MRGRWHRTRNYYQNILNFEIEMVHNLLSGHLRVRVLLNKVIELVADTEPNHPQHIVKLYARFCNFTRLQPFMYDKQFVHGPQF